MEEIRLIEKLMTLFRGSTRAHGIYTEAATHDPLKKKVKGQATTVSLPPTIRKWTQHVEGETGIGIIPINEDNQCYWGVLDIDGEVDHVALLTSIKELDLPLVPCFSKSRSAHCFCFLESPVPAGAMRSVLEEMASKLGVAGCEVFPKQDSLNLEKGDLGNWLNMPYFGKTRRGIILDDTSAKIRELSLSEFLEYAYSKRLTTETWDTFIGHMRKHIDDLDTVLEGAPPCIQYILKTQGICEGTRNKLMYNIAVYCKKKFPEEIFADKVKEIHDRFAKDPLSIRELNTVIDSVKGKEYRYQCKDAMLKQFCNSSICVDRENGIDFSTEIKSIKNATRILTTPAIYAVEVEMEADRPSKVYVTIEQLFKQDLFRKECSEQLHKTFVPVSAKQWNEISTRIVNTAINQDPPFDMMDECQLYFSLVDYLTNRAAPWAAALSTDEGVYHNLKKNKIYFKLSGFRTYLIRKGLYNKDLTVWKLGNKLNSITMPTDEIDTTTATSIKRKVNITTETLRIDNKTEYCRAIPGDEIPIAEEMQDLMEKGEYE